MVQGVLVESHMGRPTKIGGNPLHPASLGATSVHAQASILDLYDPDRSKNVSEGGELRSWEEFLASFQPVIEQFAAQQAAGLHILTEPITSASLDAQLQAVLSAFPQARWHQYTSVANDALLAGTQLAFGRPLHAIYDFSRATVVLSLDVDFLACGETYTRHVHDFAKRRAAEIAWI